MTCELTLSQAQQQDVARYLKSGNIELPMQAVIALVADKITLKYGQTVNPLDVLKVIRTAAAAGLDPTSDDVYAFKVGNDVMIGISKKGWCKVLDSRGGSSSFTYGPLLSYGEHFKTQYEWVQCTITKKDGSIVEGMRCYADEYDKRSNVWNTNPKVMLANRAFTSACAMAYGIGAYDEDEARTVFRETKAETLETNSESAPTARLEMTSTIPVKIVQDTGKCKTLDELTAQWKALPVTLQKNAAVMNAFSSARKRIESNDIASNTNALPQTIDATFEEQN